ncbi:MAG: type II toxin-antitoxin system Phd/YefM family antitoxin [Anaeroplasmataceae bacterium]|nr:type II toxin-antitoxin system Phd/YefM family antitoxin [Anaeroplasmataceae bacterium]
MPQIISIEDLKAIDKIFELCSNSNEPFFVTKNGYKEMVVMNMRVYEEKFARLDMFESILAGIDSSKKERLRDGRLTLAKLKVKYGE